MKKESFPRAVGAAAAIGVGLAMVGAPALAESTYKYDVIPQDRMTAVSTDSFEETGEGANGPIAKVLDGDSATYWHTKWNPAADPLPHWFVINLGTSVENLGRIDLLPRQSSNGSGRVNGYKVWAVNSETCDADQFGEGVNPVATGNIAADADKTVPAEITFAPVAASCVKVQYDSSWGGNNSAERVASLAEFNAYAATEVETPPEPDLGDGPQITVPEGALTITDGTLTVTVHPAFPQVVKYELGGKTVAGKYGDALTQMVINGTNRVATVGKPVAEASKVTYPVTFADVAGLSFDVEMSVADSTLEYKITNIKDANKALNYISIPNLDLVSMTEGEGASVFGAQVSVNRNNSGDRFYNLADTPVGAKPTVRPAWMITAANNDLAAGFDANAVDDETNGRPGPQHTKFNYKFEKLDGMKVASVSPAEWVYRGGSIQKHGDGGIGVDADPFVKVKLTQDANADNKVDWQDGAIAIRDIMPMPPQSEDVHNYVVARIPFNIVSQAAHPFLRTLDDTKRIALATDNLGQQVLLKGYQAEGHDSAQGDYGGHYNEKAGGLEDLKTLAEEGKNWNATFGIHVNATESYSEAYAFGEDLLQMPPAKAWGWMNQAYYMDSQKDLATGNMLERLQELRNDFPQDSNLNWLYWDVYYPRGWQANRFAQEVTDQGWRVGSEWADAQIEHNTWSHWANDEKYGGVTNKGINSKLARFVSNAYRDVFNPDPMLGNTNVVEFEGWTGHVDYNPFILNVWQRNLPAKFLQQSDIVKWEPNRIELANGTVVTSDLTSIDGTTIPTQREITFDGATVFKNGGSYLLPWTDNGTKQGAPRLYYWNPTNGAQSWELTDQWKKYSSLVLYKLTDTGREKVADVAVSNGSIALPATEANTAYVLYGAEVASVDPNWGQGSHIEDPGFFSGTTDAYDVAGNVTVEKTDRANFQAKLGEGASSISQKIKVPEGDYSAWAWIEIEPGKSRPVTVAVKGDGISGGETAGVVSIDITESSAMNATASDEKLRTYFQRVPVRFHTDGTEFTFSVTASDASDAAVAVDDLRIVTQAKPADENATTETVYFNDFEDQDDGYWPFVTGSANQGGDARTQLAELHVPYSQSGWYGLVHDGDRTATEGQKYLDNVLEGKWSLLAHQENGGLILRSTNGSFEMEKGRTYRVTFDYQAAYDNNYQFVVGEDVPGMDKEGNGTWSEKITSRTAFAMARGTGWHDADGNRGDGTQVFTQDIAVTGENPTFFGIVKNGGGVQSDLVIDNIRIEDLGVRPVVSVESQRVASDSADTYSYEVTTSVALPKGLVSNVKHELVVPEGWTAEKVTTDPADTATAEKPSVVSWKVTAPKTAAASDVTFNASWTRDGKAETGSAVVRIDPSHPELLNPIGGSDLTVTGVDSEETELESSPATNAIDGDPGTIWHTKYSGSVDQYPHWISLQAGKDGDTCTLSAFEFTTRASAANGRPKDFQIFVSKDGNDWGNAVATGSFTADAAPQIVEFGQPVEGCFVKLVELNAINGAAFGGAAEIRLGGIIEGDEPTEPTQPTEPTEPTEPTQPTEPQPTEPTQPTDPSAPTDPSQSTEPTDPSTPTEPTEPGEPVVVTPVAPSFINPSASDPASCTVKPYATVKDMAGVKYTVTVDGKELKPYPNGRYVYPYGNTIVVKATPVDGYKFAPDAQTEWSLTAMLADNCVKTPAKPGKPGGLAKTGVAVGGIALLALALGGAGVAAVNRSRREM